MDELLAEKKIEEHQQIEKKEELHEQKEQLRDSAPVFAYDSEIRDARFFEDNSLSDLKEVDQELIAKPKEQEEFGQPQYVGISSKFDRFQAGDSERMRKVRDALSRYHAARQNHEDEIGPLKNLIKACNSYTFLRLSWFRGERGKKRLKEVKDLREQAKILKLRAEAKLHTGGDEDHVQQALWRMNTEDYNLLANDVRKDLRERNRKKNLDKEYLRNKKTYTVEKLSEKQQDNNIRYILGSQQIRSIKDAIHEVMPEAYKGVDKSLTDEEAEKKEMELVHSEGTKYLKLGHDVIEFDVAGSGFDQFRKEHDGVHGIKHDDGTTADQIYEEKLDKDGYLWKNERQMLSGTLSNQRYAKKTKYSIAGPGMLNQGGVSKWSIQATRERIRDMGAEQLSAIFRVWDEELKNGREPNYYQIDLMFKGHSRGGVGASQGAMMLKYWVMDHFPDYLKYVNFHLIQYDPVPGGDVESSPVDGMERFDVKEYQGVNKGTFTIEGEKMAPLGTESDTTVIYSMVNQDDKTHRALFSPQEVLHAKRLILMPFTHDIGLDLTHIDTSQMKSDQQEKAHSMAFINATDNKVYRSSGLNELNDGVYIVDENHVMVRVDSLAQLKNILMRTMPDTYVERRGRILRAAASIFGDRAQMDEYASVDHQRNLNLVKSIVNDSRGSEFRKPIQDTLRSLRKMLSEKPDPNAFEEVLDTYQKIIDLCAVYIEKRDKGKATKKGRRRLESIKEMHSALIREKRHFYQKVIGEIEDPGALKSWNEVFMTRVQIRKEESDVKEFHDTVMGDAYRVEHSGSVSFFKEMEEEKAKSAAALSQFTESAGFTGLFRAAQQAVISAADQEEEKKGIVYEQTFDLSYREVMDRANIYSKYAPVKIEKQAREKLGRILAFDLLFGITGRLHGDLSTLRVSLQRHQDKDTKEKARSGDLSDLRDTYSINDVCADILESPLFSERLSGDLTTEDRGALYGLSDTGKSLLKSLKAEELEEMAGSTLSAAQLQIISSRLASMKALL